MSKSILSKFEYNSPVILTFSIISVLIFIIDSILPFNLTANLFTYYGDFSFFGLIRLFYGPLVIVDLNIWQEI